MKTKILKKIWEPLVCVIFPFVIPLLMGSDYTQAHIEKPMYYIIYITRMFSCIWNYMDTDKEETDRGWSLDE